MKDEPILTAEFTPREIAELQSAADGFPPREGDYRNFDSAMRKCRVTTSPSPHGAILRSMSRLILVAISLRKPNMKKKKFKRINEHALAVEITEQEGGVISLPIGQVKEVQRRLLDRMATMELEQVLDLVQRHKR